MEVETTQPRLHSDSDIPRPTRSTTPSNRNTAEEKGRVRGNRADKVRPLRGIEQQKEVMWYTEIISPLMQLRVSLTADRIRAFARYYKTVCPASYRQGMTHSALRLTALFCLIVVGAAKACAVCGIVYPLDLANAICSNSVVYFR